MTQSMQQTLATQLPMHDCWDFGADTNSINFAIRAFGVHSPIGINLEKQRLDNVKSAGYSAVHANVLDIPDGLQTDFVSLSHFVEHLPSFADVQRAIEIAVRSARKMVYISGPFFEDDDYVRSYGLKFNWGDWDDHVSRTSLKHVSLALRNLGVYVYTVSVGFPVFGTGAESLLNVSEKKNQPKFISGVHQPKVEIQFSRPAYQEFALCVPITPRVNTEAIHRERHGEHGLLRHALLADCMGHNDIRDNFHARLK